MVQWMQDGSLGNLLQCQSLDVPQTMFKYGNYTPGSNYTPCSDSAACLCKRCTTHWEKYIKLTLQCPHKGTGTLATCEHFPIVPRSTPRDYPPPREPHEPPDPLARVQVIESKARQAVSKQELATRVTKDPPKETKSKVTQSERAPDTLKQEDDKKKKLKSSTIHTVPLPPDPAAAEVAKETAEVQKATKEPLQQKLMSDPMAKHHLRENLQLHRRSHEFEKRSHEFEKRSLEFEKRSLEFEKRSHDLESRSHEFEKRSHAVESRSQDFEKNSHDLIDSSCFKKMSRELNKDKRIKKRLKDSDNYIVEHGKLIKRKGSLSSSFSALPTGPLFADLPVFTSRDDDVFEKIIAEERRADFLIGSSEDLWGQGTRGHDLESDTAILSDRKKTTKEGVEKELCLQLNERMTCSGVWEKSPQSQDTINEMFVSGNSNLNYTSSDSSRMKTSDLSLGSKEFLSLKKNRRISKSTKTGRSYSLSKAKDYRKKRAKRPKFAMTSESEEIAAENSTDIDCLEHEATSIFSTAVTERMKKRRGKKTPLEFEKRLIAGTKRYYMTKLEKIKMRSKINLDINERSSLDLQEVPGSGGQSGGDETSPVSIVSLPPTTCDSDPQIGPRNHHRAASHSPGSMKQTPVIPSHGGSEVEDNIPTTQVIQYRTRSNTSTPVISHCGTSRPSSCVISVSRLKNVRVGPSIKERFCNSLVFMEKQNKPERTRFLQYLNDERSSASLNDGFAAQLKASKIKLHRELALEERLTPNLTAAWTFSYMSPTVPSYYDYINNIDIHL